MRQEGKTRLAAAALLADGANVGEGCGNSARCQTDDEFILSDEVSQSEILAPRCKREPLAVLKRGVSIGPARQSGEKQIGNACD